MRTTSSIQFYCRESKANRQGLSPVEVSIVINGSRVFMNLPLKYCAKDFNAKRKRSDITEALDGWRMRISVYMTDLLSHNIPLTAESLRWVIQNGGIPVYKISNLFEEYLELLRMRIGTDLTEGVYRKYELVKELFFSQIDSSRECSIITPAVIKRFYAYLNQRYETSTSAGYMTKLKTFITYGIDNDRIRINPFQGIRIVKGRKDITYLTEKEIKAIKEAEIGNESLSKVRDCFIVMCGTGLSYSDLKELRKEDILEYEGIRYIKKRRVKNGQPYTSVIMSWAWDIIERYDRLPVISNQKTNVYLHQIEVILGLSKSLHCHLARHSYATLLINKSVPITSISKALGHSNQQITTSYYAKLLDRTVIEDIGKIL